MREIVLKLPDRLFAGLERQAEECETTVRNFLKMQLHAATLHHGIQWKIDLPPLPAGDAPLFAAVGMPDAGMKRDNDNDDE